MSQDTKKSTQAGQTRRSGGRRVRPQREDVRPSRERQGAKREETVRVPEWERDDWNLPASLRGWEPEAETREKAPGRAGEKRVAAGDRGDRRTMERSGPRSVGRPPERRRRAERTERAEKEERAGGLSDLYRSFSQKTRHVRRRWRRIVREKRNHRFPESERIPIQLLLFVWCMLPMLGSRVQERVLRTNQRNRQRSVERSARAEGRRGIHPALFLGTGCAAAALILFFSMYTMGTTVIYDGRVIASVSSEAAAEEARTDLEQVTAQTLGRTFTIDDSLIQYDSGLLRRQDLVDIETYQEDLSQEIGMVTAAYCLYVNGERIGATPYQGALEQLLEQMRLSATNEGTISVSFAEDVKVQEEYVATDELMNLGYLAETLYSTKTAEVTYTVAKGDTWSQIAERNGLTSKELLALNPGYNIDKLQIGEVLTMSASVPYLTMTVVQQERYVDSVAYEIEYTDTADLYQYDYKVTSPGQYGAADVVANVTYVNGVETERTVLSSVTLREPVTEHQLRGTKIRPTWYPTGTFRWPTSGRITSYFGGRRSPGGIGSTNHKGIDIAVPRGTPIYAADGGTVTYAGWMSGYGYLVQIDHGNGYVTRYGHNSSLTCSVGQKVYKGQQIARAGSTGNSTGSHCHFEVRYNGVARNPLNYL